MLLIVNLVFLIFFELTVCTNYENRILDGNNATIEEFPYMASLQESKCDKQYHKCGGVIVSSTVVITAAHCIPSGNNTSTAFVRVGSTYSDKDGEIVDISQWHIHPKYNYCFTGHHFDVAVLILKQALTYSETIQPISLKNLISEIPDGTLANVTGWGAIDPEGCTPPAQLQKVQISKVSSNICNESYEGKIGNDQICFGYINGRKNSCFGDSGGPLVINGSLVGLVSFGSEYCGNDPTVYAKVSAEEVIGFITQFVDF